MVSPIEEIRRFLKLFLPSSKLTSNFEIQNMCLELANKGQNQNVEEKKYQLSARTDLSISESKGLWKV